ncbi:MAG: hypothetical protein A2Z11_00680 [Candidatus Woykebacteria bacterium RBG_16_43_9]|uniref:Soluble ligand binding domain-containing protein n=1 Tax=Candidatus Woykebacteria bacterium RBG_16_43_9 TaxID=1802596 RepID=A0A1G1WCK2_9BACT|nr:MAG: hypothetical protein A2Z11_00680 [Candidatus Woykebacteria bacterium RBG_16_43_9]
MNWRKNKLFKKILRQAAKFQTSIILALIGTALIGAGLSASNIFKNSAQPQFVPAEQNMSNDEKIVIDISGAIKNPGIYKLESGSRVDDAIRKAGGLSKDADRAWISKNINLAGKLVDAQKIYIPKEGESGSVSGVSQGSTNNISSKININTATEAELDSLPGIGEVRTGKIIANRPYSSIEELVTKKVLGEGTFEKIKSQITTN